MAFGRKKEEAATEEAPSDPTGWLLDSGIAEVLIMNTAEIKYMCMLFYTFFHGTWIENIVTVVRKTACDELLSKVMCVDPLTHLHDA